MDAALSAGTPMSSPDLPMPGQRALALALLERIERPVALCGPGGELVALNALFRLELARLGVAEADLVFASGALQQAGEGIALPLIASDLADAALPSPEWQLLELPGRVVSRAALARLFEARRHDGLALLQVHLNDSAPSLRLLSESLNATLLDVLERRLLTLLPRGSTLCRGGGPCLLALIPAADLGPDRPSLEAALAAWATSLAAPISLDGHRLEPQLSLGIRCCPEDGASWESLLEASGRDLQARHRRLSTTTAHALRDPLAIAIDQRRLDLQYQPIVDLRSGRIQAAEVLCRWRDPQLGLISPCEFIAVAEASEQINQLGSWLVDAVFAQIRRWRDRGIGPRSVAINISPLQLNDDRLLELLCEGLRCHGLSASGITLEITENRALEVSAELRRRLWSLHELGFTLAMDDYGTGYSSLQRLLDLPFRALKVDRCLIEAIETDPLQQAMLRGVVELQQATALKVVVEGVERPGQRARLLELGCRLAQGFLFSKPLSAAALESLLCSGEVLHPLQA